MRKDGLPEAEGYSPRRVRPGALRPAARTPRVLDAVLEAQVGDVLLDPRAARVLLELRFHFVEGRELRIANVLDLDHVPAELRVHGLGAELAFRKRLDRIAEWLHEVGGRAPTELTALVLRSRILRARLREVGELCPLLQLGDDLLRVGFLVDEDVTDVVLLVAALRLDRVVLLVQVGV